MPRGELFKTIISIDGPTQAGDLEITGFIYKRTANNLAEAFCKTIEDQYPDTKATWTLKHDGTFLWED